MLLVCFTLWNPSYYLSSSFPSLSLRLCLCTYLPSITFAVLLNLSVFSFFRCCCCCCCRRCCSLESSVFLLKLFQNCIYFKGLAEQMQQLQQQPDLFQMSWLNSCTWCRTASVASAEAPWTGLLPSLPSLRMWSMLLFFQFVPITIWVLQILMKPMLVLIRILMV